jgi:hypothetical protein
MVMSVVTILRRTCACQLYLFSTFKHLVVLASAGTPNPPLPVVVSQ